MPRGFPLGQDLWDLRTRAAWEAGRRGLPGNRPRRRRKPALVQAALESPTCPEIPARTRAASLCLDFVLDGGIQVLSGANDHRIPVFEHGAVNSVQDIAEIA